MPLEASTNRNPRSGLDLLRAQIHGEISGAPFNDLLGARLVTAEEGYVELRCPMREELLNRKGSGHGGFVSTMLDNACGMVADSTAQAGRAWTTMDLHVRMLRPLTLEAGTLRVVGEVEKSGRSVMVTLAKLYAEDQTLLASATSSLFALDV